ncbi:MAG: antitoxin family protein [Thermoguttaceae bacterium]
MAIVVEATYEDGVLKPAQPLPLGEHQKVRVIVESETSPIMEAYGIAGWKGDHATLERFALDPELDPQESP